ncbi:MAG: glycosyltransferase family 39 protein [Candidatus Dojkabacteria bacterium]|nr:MAG: glycosyltransferase family 39 protein [Candidatus Dojkabacteria bacterium]
MDAGRYVSIAYSYAGDGAYKEEVIEGSVCNSALICREDGSAVTQYLPMYPIILSYGNLIKGYFGMKVIQILVSFMSAVTFYVILKRLFGKYETIIALGLMLFSFNAIQLNYSKEFMTEVFAQSLMLLIVWLYLLNKEKEQSIITSIAVVLLSVLFLTKLDAIVISLILPVYYLTRSLHKKSKWDDYFLVLSLLATALFMYFFSQPYINKTIGGTASRPLPVYILVAVSVALSFIFILSHTHLISRFKSVSGWWRKRIALLLALMFMVVSAVVFISTAYTITTAPITEQNIELINLVRLNYFYPVYITIIGLLGLSLLMYRRHSESVVIFIVGILALLPILESSHSSPLYWWSRRYLFITIPVTLLAYCYVIYAGRLNKRVYIALISLTCSAVLITAYMASTSFGFIQNRGSDETTRSAFIHIEPDSVIVYSSGYSEVSYLSQLTHRYNIDGYILDSNTMGDVEQVLPLAKYKVIYLANIANAQDTLKMQISGHEYVQSNCTDIHISYERPGAKSLVCADLGLFCSWDTFISWEDVNNSYKICEYSR